MTLFKDGDVSSVYGELWKQCFVHGDNVGHEGGDGAVGGDGDDGDDGDDEVGKGDEEGDNIHCDQTASRD